jgi:hypothetical protein
MKMDKVTYTDINGRKHKQYGVRSNGPGRGFLVCDNLTNHVVQMYDTRAECWEYLRTEDEDDYQASKRGAGKVA